MEFAETLTALSTACAAALAILEYPKAKRWKSAEWLAQQSRQFAADPEVRNALRMLDWNGRHVPLFPDHPLQSKRQVIVTYDDVTEALRVTPTETDRRRAGEKRCGDSAAKMLRFDRKEAAIRDCFDAFFEGMNRFAEYEAQKLVTTRQLKGHVAYWAQFIGGDSPPRRGASRWTPELKSAIRHFAKSYGYGEGLALLDRIAAGKALRPPTWGELFEDLRWRMDWDLRRWRGRRRGATKGSR